MGIECAVIAAASAAMSYQSQRRQMFREGDNGPIMCKETRARIDLESQVKAHKAKMEATHADTMRTNNRGLYILAALVTVALVGITQLMGVLPVI